MTRKNSQRTKMISMVVSQSRTIALSYADLTVGGAELEEVKTMPILGLPSDSKLKSETHLREVVSKAARSLEIVRRVGKLSDCPRVLKSCFSHFIEARNTRASAAR